jgi:hypothetical protein
MESWSQLGQGRSLYVPFVFSPSNADSCPVDFFVGMGDINSTYVKPRATDIPAAMGPVTPEATEEDDAALQDQIALKRAKALEDQLEARPLKRKQEELEKQDLETEEKTAQESSDGVTPVESKETVPAEEANTSATNGTGEIPPHHRQALLRNDDQELDRVDKVRFPSSRCSSADKAPQLLREIHARFFDALSRTRGGLRIPPSSEPSASVLFDVRVSFPSNVSNPNANAANSSSYHICNERCFEAVPFVSPESSHLTRSQNSKLSGSQMNAD